MIGQIVGPPQEAKALFALREAEIGLLPATACAVQCLQLAKADPYAEPPVEDAET